MEKSINIAMLGNSKMEILLKNRKKKKMEFLVLGREISKIFSRS